MANVRIKMRWWTKSAIFCWCLWCFVANRQPVGRVAEWMAKYGFRVE